MTDNQESITWADKLNEFLGEYELHPFISAFFLGWLSVFAVAGLLGLLLHAYMMVNSGHIVGGVVELGVVVGFISGAYATRN